MPRKHNVPGGVAPTAARAVAVALVGGAAALVTGLSPGVAATPHASQVVHAANVVETASTARSTSLPRSSDVVGGRFVASAVLDAGTFEVVRAPSPDQPTLSERRAAQEIWSSTALVGYTQEGHVGFGLVTISMRAKGVPHITKLAAWVGFAKSSGAANCPAEVIPSVGTASPTSGPSPQQAPSDGYAAVVIGARNGSPAVTYTARSILCNALSPATLAQASEEYSVPWKEVGAIADNAIRVHATLPPCGVLQGNSSAGSAHEITIAVRAVVPDVHGRCKGSLVANQIVSFGPDANTPGAPAPLVTASTKIRHGRLGPTATAATAAGATPTATSAATRSASAATAANAAAS